MKRIVYLMYHDVLNEADDRSGFATSGANYYKISAQMFKEQLKSIVDVIKSDRYSVDVILTFDDGGSSFYGVIAPLLEQYGFIGHFFIATDYIGQPGFISEQEIKQLVERGHIIGSHSSSHPSNFTTLSSDERYNEWEKSIEILSKIIDGPIREISIPNGYFIEHDICFYRSLGVSNIYTSTLDKPKQIDGINVLGRFAITSKTSVNTIIKFIKSRTLVKILAIKLQLLELMKKMLGNSYITIKRTMRNGFK